MGMSPHPWGSISFRSLINAYAKLQSKVISQVKALASSISTATPGKFLLLQFSMSQVAQIGESISNLVSQMQAIINNTVRNQKGQ